MRWLAAFLSVLMTLFCPAAIVTEDFTPDEPAAAEILYGTPEMDGALDRIYTQSYSYTIAPGTMLFYTGGKTPAETERVMGATGCTVYYLYDDEYLYACAVVHDETPTPRGEEWRGKTTWPWNDDGIELYFGFSSDHKFAVHTDYQGFRSVIDTKIWDDNRYNAGIYADTPKEDYAVSRPDKFTYIVEIRFALDDGMIAGSQVGVFPEIDDLYAVDKDGNPTGIGARCPAKRDPRREEFLVTLSDTAAETDGRTEEEAALLTFGIERVLAVFEE